MSPQQPTVALAISGGNALGAYAAGAYQVLHDRGYLPDVVSGASIGAVTGGLIVGNPIERRIEQLREFWRQAATGSAFGFAPATGRGREIYNAAHALQSLILGRPGLFRPRVPGMLSILPGMPPDVALFDGRPLVATLERTVDFEFLNRAEVRLLVTAVDMETGQSVVFDNRRHRLEPVHFLATTAFAPGFPPVDIDGRCLGDPGLVANLPIDAVLDPPPSSDLLCFAIDLFEARGARPFSLDTGLERAQDIVFGAQSTRTLDARAREHRLRRMIGSLAEHVPLEQRKRGVPAALVAEGRSEDITVVLIAYRPQPHELSAKTLEFSRASIDERWERGIEDMSVALDQFERGDATETAHGFTFYDARRAGR